MKYNKATKGSRNVPFSRNIKTTNKSHFKNAGVKLPKRKRPEEYTTYTFKLVHKEDFQTIKSFIDFIKLKYPERLIYLGEQKLINNFKDYNKVNSNFFRVVDSFNGITELSKHMKDSLIAAAKDSYLPIITIKVNKFKIKIIVEDEASAGYKIKEFEDIVYVIFDEPIVPPIKSILFKVLDKLRELKT